MNQLSQAAIRRVLSEHRLMSAATIGPEGWPEVSNVSYVNEGASIYFVCDSDSHEAANIAGDSRISLTVLSAEEGLEPGECLSIVAHAYRATDPTEQARILKRMRRKFPEREELHRPVPAGICVIKAIPEFIALPSERDDGAPARADAPARPHETRPRASVQNETNWQLRPPPKLRCRHRPLARALQLGQAH